MASINNEQLAIGRVVGIKPTIGTPQEFNILCYKDRREYTYTRKQIKEYLISHPNNKIDGLIISIDNRMIYTGGNHVNNCNKKKYTIEVQNLIPGYITAADVYDYNNNFLVGKNYILNLYAIQIIQKSLPSNSEIEIYDIKDVKEALTKNKNFKYALASFYANKVANSPYIHDEYLIDFFHMKRNTTAQYEIKQKCFDIFWHPTKLMQDANILYLMYSIYGHHMYTFEHSVNVATYSVLIYGYLSEAKGEKLNKETIIDFLIAGLIHDAGKLYVDKEILDKGELSEEEKEIIKQHPTTSAKIAKQFLKCNSPILYRYNDGKGNLNERGEKIVSAAMYHHLAYQKREQTKSNKKGKPYILKSYPNDTNIHYQIELGKDVSDFCSILSIADTFDGFISPRPYHGATFRTCIQTCLVLEEDAIHGKLNESIVKELKRYLNLDCEAFPDKYGIKIAGVEFDKTLKDKYRNIDKEVNRK